MYLYTYTDSARCEGESWPTGVNISFVRVKKTNYYRTKNNFHAKRLQFFGIFSRLLLYPVTTVYILTITVQILVYDVHIRRVQYSLQIIHMNLCTSPFQVNSSVFPSTVYPESLSVSGEVKIMPINVMLSSTHKKDIQNYQGFRRDPAWPRYPETSLKNSVGLKESQDIYLEIPWWDYSYEQLRRTKGNAGHDCLTRNFRSKH